MKKRFTLIATLVAFLSVSATDYMFLKLNDGSLKKYNVENIEEAWFSSDSVVEANKTMLDFEILTDSTVAVSSAWDIRKGEYEGIIRSVIIPSKVRIDGKEYSVTDIYEEVFSDLRDLTYVEIPSSVTNIGEKTFSGCTGLTSIEIPSSVTNIGYDAFSGCTGLTSIEIPSSVTNIGAGAFSGCTSLTSVKIPSSVTSIEYRFFENCRGLTSIELPSSVTNIGEDAFSGCTSLTSVKIPSSVTNIGRAAFSGCTSLTSIEIPASLTLIESNTVFSGCDSMNSIYVDEKNPNYSSFDGILYNKQKTEIIYVPQGIKGSIEIASGVERIFGSPSPFKNCTNLTSIYIPESVYWIADWAFSGCENLDVVIDNLERNVDVELNSFSGVKSVKWQKEVDPSLVADTSAYASLKFRIMSEYEVILTSASCDRDSVNIPAYVKIDGKVYDVTSIESVAFENCSILTFVYIPASVTEIRLMAFSNCENLDVEIDNKESVTGSSGFEGVKSVKWLK